MITFSPFKAEHIFALEMQESQQWAREYMRLEDLRTLENEWGTTLWDGSNPVLCGGVSAYWPGRAMLWSFISGNIGRKSFIEAHNIAKTWIRSLPFRRLEAYVECDFTEGHRWIRLLGFELEAERMRGFHINGADCALYALVRD